MPGTRDRRTRHRSAPRRSLRFSFVLPFVVPAVCLTGLWGYTAAGLVDEHIQLQADADRDSSVARPAQAVLSALQNERRLTAVRQAGRTSSARTDLDAARKKTDAAIRAYRGSAGPDTSDLRRRAKSLDDALAALADRREAIDGRSLSAADAFQYFTDTITRGVSLVTAAVRSDDASLANGGAATASLVQITEMLSRQDALLSGALPSGRMPAVTRAQFAEYLALQREFRAGLTTGHLPAGTATGYARITDGAQWTTLGTIGDSMATAKGTALPQRASSWPDAADGVLGDLRSLGAESLRGLADDASGRADDLLLGMLLGTAATLAALAGGAVLALRARRATLGRLTELQSRTEELTRTLPLLLARIERGERVDPAVLAPQGHHATDELERLAGAIDRLGRVAADTAVRQSLGREGTEKVFAQLIRRTQILIHRLISLLDDLERKHEDSDLLKDIFKVDHLATRVRRHAENLVILSGSPPSRRMTAPVSLTDVMRSAVAETEQYTRVKVKNLPSDRRVALAGRAVADVTHLLAELIENGTSFSPPDTQVSVSATKVAKGLAIHVEDHGLGMPAEKMAYANELLAHPPKLDMTSLGEDPRLGHFVVARLAERHKIKVELRESVYGGTLVVVLLPSALLEEHQSPVLDQLKSAAAAAAGHVLETESRQAALDAEDRAFAGAVVGAAGGVAAAVGAGADVLTHTRLPDHSGFPEYGGAGLLPPASEHPVPSPAPDQWAPAQQAPVPQTHTTAHAAASGDRSGYPGPAAGHAQPQAGPPPGREPGAGRTAPAGQAPEPDAARPLTTPQVLPQRTRGASLAQQLRKEAAQTQGRPEGEGDKGVISPDASARAMIAIQQGLKRARMSETDGPAGADGRSTDSREPGANQL
ncbi:nitrate- and nitrite sensing domain-containing protein [Streptomyces yaanensis]|uniref:histidine kinase n=1 Tax=Streptomyces yaanensis TaxID=1142239 RepID=A0ABV7S9P4_9ACTN|nr:nitrate- and nitrite sensing domain-containing protein [Streptomyces sp. CGMCC 4.7035]WNB99735.1 nitrate- and nitrite sensing domain-containing protein [Streptomyces sp. CGMCC 4.7035]